MGSQPACPLGRPESWVRMSPGGDVFTFDLSFQVEAVKCVPGSNSSLRNIYHTARGVSVGAYKHRARPIYLIRLKAWRKVLDFFILL